jgi:hypothetical protein
MRRTSRGTRLPRRSRALALAGCLLLIGLGLAMTGTQPAGAAPGSRALSESAATQPAEVEAAVVPHVYIWADNVNVRYCPHFTCAPRTQVDRGWYPYVCTAAGDRVTYGAYTNFYWTRIAVDTDGDGYYETPGWVSDVFVSGGGNDEPAKQPTDWICGA